MKYFILLVSTLMLSSSLTVKKQWSQQKSVNNPPVITIPFDQVDTDGDGNITVDEYISEAGTLDTTTPFSSIMGIIIGVGILVVL